MHATATNALEFCNKRRFVSNTVGLVGDSPVTNILKMEIIKLAPLRAPVLITGETGTGKELVATNLHECSGRTGRFIAVNCGGLTESMHEDTLFGHERGSFTGAAVFHRGVFEQARGGTLFLDEIGELPLSQQASLLRVLDTGKIRRIGGEEEIPVETRLVTATNRNLSEMVEEGHFRLDLYHRLAALRISLQPLRDRPEDVYPLSLLFLESMADDVGKKILDPGALKALMEHPWPGNARELRNVLYRAAAMSIDQSLHLEDLIFESAPKKLKVTPFRLESVPDCHIKEVLQKNDNNVAAAARELGVARTTLRDKLARLTSCPQ